MILRGRAVLFVLFSALVSLFGSVAAQEPPRSGEPLHVAPAAKEAISRLRSPYCPGEMLAVCPSSGGAMLRDSIQAMAVAGMSADSIIERVIGEYGEEWRAEPVARGMGLWAWLLPPLVLIGGLGMVGVILARRRTEGDLAVSETGPGPLVAPEDEARLKDAMKEMDEAEDPAF